MLSSVIFCVPNNLYLCLWLSLMGYFYAKWGGSSIKNGMSFLFESEWPVMTSPNALRSHGVYSGLIELGVLLHSITKYQEALQTQSRSNNIVGVSCLCLSAKCMETKAAAWVTVRVSLISSCGIILIFFFKSSSLSLLVLLLLLS